MPTDTTADELNAAGEYEPTQAEMDAYNNFDGIADVPSNVQVIGDLNLSEPTLSAFPPDQQDIIRQRAGSNSPEAIKGAIHSYLMDRKRDFLINAGAGEGATHTQRVMLEQASKVRDIKAELDRVDAELAEVVGYETQFDEKGAPIPVPIHRLTGQRRKEWEARRATLGHQMGLIAGIEGEREISEANRADAVAAHEMRTMLADHKEIRRRAVHMAREDRLNAAAAQRAKMLKGGLGW
ncbi:MAG TPA: hypothetical protein VNS79_02300 [Sphingobium sp.]|nr:hypothetical protein [Sphingobium sp.]